MERLKVRVRRRHGDFLAPFDTISTLWPSVKFENPTQYQHLLYYVGCELKKFQDFPDYFAVKDTDTFLGLLSQLRESPGLDRTKAEGIVTIVSGQSSTGNPDSRQNNALILSLESALGIWSNVLINIPRRVSAVSAPTLLWETGTLEDLIKAHFHSRRRDSPQRDMESRFTMEHLSSAYGYKPIWTGNLLEHLKVDHESKQVMIFEHKICLWNHQRFSGGQINSCTPLPADVVAEALDTLNLLFPWSDEFTKVFLEHEGKSFYGLGKCNRERQLDLAAYKYWGAEIEDLADILSQPPRGRAQLLIDKDGRNLLDVWTFWTAFIFGVLAVIGVITSIYSARYAKLAYDVGMLQYQLALAQACSEGNATDLLPGFCT